MRRKKSRSMQHNAHHGKPCRGMWTVLLTLNLHLTPSTQQAEKAGFTHEEITRRASQFSLKINKRQSS
jgi:hypothetical protein